MSGYTVLNARSISELPDPEALRGKLAYVNLPVVCLALLRSPNMNFGVFVVTDFTEYANSSYAVGAAHPHLPESFSIGKIYALEWTKVFAITCPLDKVDAIWDKLCQYSSRMQHYDPQDPDRCNFSQEGVIAFINMRVKEYNNATEGWLSRFHVCSRAEMKKSAFKANLKKYHFGSFMERYLAILDKSLYDNLLPSFPIDSYRLPGDLLANTGGVKRPSEDLITQAPKSRTISAAQITFQQQFTQPQAPTEESDEEELPSFTAQGTTPRRTQAPQFTQLAKHNSTKSQVLSSPIGHSKWLQYAVNKVQFSTLCSLALDKAPEVTTYETTCFLASIIPDVNMLFTRPYKRTIKISPIRFTLTGSKNQKVFAELHSEEEINTFFGINEVEEVLPKMEQITRRLKQLAGLQIKIRLQRDLMDLDFGYQKLYWACRTPLVSLSDIWD